MRRAAAILPVLLMMILLVDHSTPTQARSQAQNDQKKAAAVQTYQVCDKPDSCRTVPKYTQKVETKWTCPIWKPCTFQTSAVVSASARAPAAPRVDERLVRQFPKIVSSQLAMPLYQFSPEHSTLEAARRLLQAGANSFKFDLKNQATNGKPILALNNKGWLPLVTNQQLPYQQLFDMPFTHYFFWAGRTPAPGRGMDWTDIDGVDVYKELYKLVVWLLKTYNNSGKTFFIGHWEGDWCIRDAYNKEMNANPKKVQALVKLLSDKQRAVDDAKRDNAWVKNVAVWHYAEANLVEQSMKRGGSWMSVANTVIGQVRPTLDFVSVSVGGDSLREVNPSPALHKAFDYVRTKLPAKPGVPEPRVFAGEFYFDMRNKDDTIALYAPTPELQKQRGCWAAASGVAWGAQHMLWWQFYDNESTKSGGFRGYWLVDNGNRDTPLFRAYQTYFADAQDFVRSVIAATGKPPGDYAFRVWATERLIQLSGKTDVWRPKVLYWGK